MKSLQDGKRIRNKIVSLDSMKAHQIDMSKKQIKTVIYII